MDSALLMLFDSATLRSSEPQVNWPVQVTDEGEHRGRWIENIWLWSGNESSSVSFYVRWPFLVAGVHTTWRERKKNISPPLLYTVSLRLLILLLVVRWNEINPRWQTPLIEYAFIVSEPRRWHFYPLTRESLPVFRVDRFIQLSTVT